MRPLVDEPDLLGLNGLGHFVPLVLSFPTIPNLAMVQEICANVITVTDTFHLTPDHTLTEARPDERIPRVT